MVNFRRLPGAAGAAIIPAAFASMTMLVALPPTPVQAQTPGADLKVLTPRSGEALGTTKFNLDVRYKSTTGSPVVTAELWVDGVRWVRRDLENPRATSTLSFDIDGTTLSAGTHTFVVKVFTGNGGVSSTQVQLVAGNNEGVVSGDFGGPQMTFLTPGNGKRVSGTVELLIDAKAKNGQNPYVTIYVDKQFKTLKNYPPYSYSWDTTQVPNGYHTVEASGYVDANNATTTRTMRVFVDNPGGYTNRSGDIKDLTDARKQTEGAPTTQTPATAVARPLTIPIPKTTKTAVLKPTGEATLASSASVAMDAMPAALGLADSAAPKISNTGIDIKMAVPASVAAPKPAAPVVKAVEAKVQSLSAIATMPAPTLAAPKLVAPKLATPKAEPIVFSAPAPVAPKARVSEAKPAPVIKPKVVQVAQVTVPNRTRSIMFQHPEKKTIATPRAAVRPSMEVLPTRKPLMVAFDGTQIAFDVAPRVEAGIPMAPFRQIFEHTGGKVSWSKDTRVVHAVNADREIVIAVGSGTARVNGVACAMEKPAFLEQGRTIVPISFVGKALDVEVQYDPATGRLLITSK